MTGAGHRPAWFRIRHRITVRPERLTFAGRPWGEVTGAVKFLLATVSHRSFAGVVIHDLDGFHALWE
ncbi:MAG TPA: hypothetical protein VLS44_01230 [Nitrospira sp.]|nr:hypothetical protein [Nitrospira sp.]